MPNNASKKRRQLKTAPHQLRGPFGEAPSNLETGGQHLRSEFAEI
jgi:hypothetical protein